jgi:hypothetical protein
LKLSDGISGVRSISEGVSSNADDADDDDADDDGVTVTAPPHAQRTMKAQMKATCRMAIMTLF